MKSVWLVVPCYNEEQRLRAGEFLGALERYSWLTLCFVNDCSTDGTARILNELAKHERAVCVTNQKNLGKARSVRVGVLQGLDNSECECFGYWDADLATPLEELDGMVGVLCSSETLMMNMGVRVNMLGREIVRKRSRHYIGRVFATLACGILGVPVYDTQCGAKVFNRKFAEIVFAKDLITDWCFDIELLIRLQKYFMNKSILHERVYEYPLNTWKDVEGSKLKIYHFYYVAKDLIRLLLLSRKF